MNTKQHNRAANLFFAEEREQTIAAVSLRDVKFNHDSIIPNKASNTKENTHPLNRLQELDESVQTGVLNSHHLLNNAKAHSKNIALHDGELSRINALIDDISPNEDKAENIDFIEDN